MRVAGGACILLLLAAGLPHVSARKLENLPETVPDKEEPADGSFGFFTTTIANFLGLSNDNDNNVNDNDNNYNDNFDGVEEAVDLDKPEYNFIEEGEKGLNEVPLDREVEVEGPDNPEVMTPVDEAADDDLNKEGIMSDEPAREEDNDNNNDNDNDRNPDEEDNKEDDDVLLETDPAKPKPSEDDDDKDKEDKENDKEVEDPSKPADEEADKGEDKEEEPAKPDTRSSLEKKLDEIAEKEDKILKELDKEKAERERRQNSTGLVPVSRLRSSLGGLLPAAPGTNGSDNMMSDRKFQPIGGSSLVSRVSSRISTCSNCLVSWPSPQCPLEDAARELKQWISDLVDLLGNGCPNSCNGDQSRRCCYRDEADIDLALQEMTQMAREMYQIFRASCSNCPRDGGWSEWCEWGACSVTCGRGTRERSRQCNNPAPVGGGVQCSGQPRQSESCYNPDCCTDGNWAPWSPWSPCSATCGSGTMERARVCTNPPPNHCGRTCPGPNTDMRSCDSGVSCCTDGNWGFWGQWSQCQSSCGMGMRERSRQCDSPPPSFCGRSCPGVPRETEMCNTNIPCAPDCLDGNWGPWQPWSRCSATCGQGMETRMRRCDNPAPNFCGRRCPGSASDSKPCTSPIPCCIPQDGNWSPWTYWSACSATCGSGTKSRSRRCDSPPPNQCGRRCLGPTSDNQRCQERPCCQNGNWGNWGPWDTPTASCGIAIRQRRRRCDSPPADYCGLPCPGPNQETDEYNTGIPCRPVCVPINGNWSPWSPFSPCSVSCGPGTKDRFRTCTNPMPNECGRSCPGPDRDTQRCDGGRCCIPQDGNWSPWSMWSSCPVSCGTGTVERTRTCSSPPPNRCGQPCPGRPRDTQMCRRQQCCIPQDGNWSPWSMWSSCPVSCGTGTVERTRTCSSPPPNRCGQPCPGRPRDTQMCRRQSCCIPQDGNWSPWSMWSSCPVTCGTGTVERTRSCSSPPPNRCGQPCPGQPRDTQMCRRQSCCIPQDGNWSPWSMWSSCPVSCGTGTVERTRSCSSPPPNRCGQSCPGSPRDTQMCRLQPCCIPQDGNWSPWSMWSSCPVTCGTGTVERTRTCSSPPPNRCGQPCPGRPRDTQMCRRQQCCTPQDGNWSPWTPWSSCSVTCGTGTKDRTRTCSSPPPNRCGQPCQGPPRDTQRCRRQPCCVNRVWEPWGPWSQPGVTCGTATRERRRRCSIPFDAPECGPCPGPEYERESFDTGQICEECIDGNWSPWSFWGPCSKTCGEGMQERDRTCTDPAPNRCGQRCMGPRSDMRRCNEGPCCIPQDGNWGDWAQWSPCSASCGSGSRERTRRCDRPRPNQCGRSCPGPAFDTEICQSRPCCQDGNWGPWGPWSDPGVTCGPYVIERRRRCDSPPPDYCGRRCPGPEVDQQNKLGIICEVCRDGNWGQWGPWSPCPVTCGTAERERRRRCDSPPPDRNCGAPCPGTPLERSLQRCGPDGGAGNWGPWGPWGGCSRTCGGGRQTRRRRCDAGACATRCPGFDSDTQACNEGPCCVPREWTQWTPWSNCDATCGSGRRSRQRTCRSVGYGDDCGSRCPGNGQEVEPCYNLPRCPQPAEWTQWNNWCPCDCGKGVRARRRTCEQRGGFGRGGVVDISNCQGAAREEEYCDVRQACPVCVEDCTGRLDGEYPACTSCSDYLTCSGGRPGMLSCSASGYVYDAFIKKCVPPPSPSCTLVDCVSTCSGQIDGRYPSCSGCEYYIQCTGGRDSQLSCPPGQEFNSHRGQCESGRSPTCIRAIRNRLEFMYRDAPADSYFPTDELTDEERKALYMELREEAGVAAKFNRSHEDVFGEEEARRKEEERKAAEEKAEEALREIMEDVEEREEEEEEALKEIMKDRKEEEEEEAEEEEEEVEEEGTSVTIEKEESPEEAEEGNRVLSSNQLWCQKTCVGQQMGYYQSCKGCHHYLVCTKHGVARHFKCPHRKVWDDRHKKCRKRSSTCTPRQKSNLTKP